MADVQITVGADASAVERAAAVATGSWKNAATAISSAMGDAARKTIGSLSEIVLAQGRVNFSSQQQDIRAFEQSSARLATSMGRDLDSVRSSILSTGVEIGKRPQEVAGWASEVGKLTYNFKGAVDAQKGLAGLAAETGRNVEDYRGLAAELSNVGRVSGDTTDVIGVLAAQAEKLGTVGGVAQFADQIEALGGTISQFTVKSTADFTKVTALAGELGKNFKDPQAAMRAQQGAISALASDPMRWERYLGRDLMDPKTGQIPADKIPAIMQEIVEKTKARFGRRAQRVLQMNFGNEAGAAMYNADYAAAAEAAGLGPSKKPEKALEAYKATDAGKRQVADAELAKSSNALLGSSTLLGKAADALQQFASKNPLLSTAATSVAGSLAGTAVAAGGKAVTGFGGALLGAGGMAAAGTAAAGLAAGGVGLGAGYLAGKGLLALDEKYGSGVSDREKLSAADAETKRLKKIRDEKRAAAGWSPLGMSVPPAETQSGGQQAATMELAGAIGKAVAAEMRNVKIDVKTRADTPVEVTTQGASKFAAGDQSGG